MIRLPPPPFSFASRVSNYNNDHQKLKTGPRAGPTWSMSPRYTVRSHCCRAMKTSMSCALGMVWVLTCTASMDRWQLYVGGPVVRQASDKSRFADSIAEVVDDNSGKEPQVRELTISGIICLTVFGAHPNPRSSLDEEHDSTRHTKVDRQLCLVREIVQGEYSASRQTEGRRYPTSKLS